MAIQRSLLHNILKNNVVEMKWVRRQKKTGYAETRRALATNSRLVLNSEFGYKVLHFRIPTMPNIIDQEAHNLVTYWDIFRQKYRNSACETLHLITIIPVSNAQEVNKFWVYFRDNIKDMTPQQKIEFFNS